MHVGFEAERIAQFVRAESLDMIEARDTDVSGIAMGTLFGSSWLASSSFRAYFQ